MNGQSNRKILMTQIVHEQTDRIVAEFKRQRDITLTKAQVGGGVAFLYAEGQLLVRDEHMDRVLAILGPQSSREQVEDVIAGIKLVKFGPPPPDQPQPRIRDEFERIDQELGEGIATPNHILTVTGEAGPCPATEPQEVYFEIEPYPSVCAENDGGGVLIYIADTGLLSDTGSHPWLAGVHGETDPLEPKPGETILPYAGHGTFVAGVARCLAPKADVFVSNVFSIAGSALETDFVKDLDVALDRGVDIFNLSVTTPTRKDLRLLGFEAWLRRLHQHKNVVCVVAAGNDGSRLKFWPAAFSGMVSVGALAADWRSRATFSNHGDWVAVYAPGRDLVNAYATGTYKCEDKPYKGEPRKFYGMAKWSGTSFSTPVVSGLIAARMSRTGENARQAAAALLAGARSQAIPGVGPVLLPYGNKF